MSSVGVEAGPHAAGELRDARVDAGVEHGDRLASARAPGSWSRATAFASAWALLALGASAHGEREARRGAGACWAARAWTPARRRSGRRVALGAVVPSGTSSV